MPSQATAELEVLAMPHREAPPQEQTRRRPLRGPTRAAPGTEDEPARHEPPEKPQGITEKTWLSLGLKGRVYITSLIKDGNALKAYEVAGYTSDSEKGDSEKRKRNAYNVSRGKRIQRALLEHADHRKALAEAKKDFALDWIVSEHERLMQLAERRGELAVATRNLELIGRTRGVYADNVLVDLGQRRQYSETERLEAARLSRLALLDGMGSTGEGGDSEEHTVNPTTSSALPAPPPGGDGDGHARDEGDEEGRERG